MNPTASSFAFGTSLGWIGLEFNDDDALCGLVFGYHTRRDALIALGRSDGEPKSSLQVALQERLERYAEGMPDAFRDVRVHYPTEGQFAHRVWELCRQIPPGTTISYRELARRAGAPNAARAVGQVMAKNRIPIVVPCHRVVAANGGLGGYSAPGGLATKHRLLELEAGAALIAVS
jgi:methylated-DNA-[protein]-cysteine S-methyltransferase